MELNTIITQLTDFDTPLLANTIGTIDATPPHTWYTGGSIQSVTPSLGPTVGVELLDIVREARAREGSAVDRS